MIAFDLESRSQEIHHSDKTARRAILHIIGAPRDLLGITQAGDAAVMLVWLMHINHAP